jgi:DNA modification methylase
VSVRLLLGDCRDVLKTLEAGSVNTCVTSPPYFGLRDYGVDGQIGLEHTPDAFVAQMVEVFREVRRVLRDDGTLWLNLGDSYAGSWGAQAKRDTPGEISRNSVRNHPKRARASGKIRQADLKPKDMIGIPWMVAFALRADGWFLRQDIIWSKPNPMPESVRDRCTKAHEYVFLLSKGPRYYFDAAAISEPASPNTHARVAQDVANQAGSLRAHGGDLGPRGREGRSMKAVVKQRPSGWAEGQGSHGSIHPEGRSKGRRVVISSPKTTANAVGSRNNEDFSGAISGQVVDRRNKRSVWTVPTEGFKEAHFATYPPSLIEPCILAGAPKGGVVLDPFGGAGTTGLVADRLQRNAVLIELNPEYAEIARRRLHQDAGMFSSVEEADGHTVAVQGGRSLVA